MPPLDLQVGEVYEIAVSATGKNNFAFIVATREHLGRQEFLLMTTNPYAPRREWIQRITNYAYKMKGNVHASHE